MGDERATLTVKETAALFGIGRNAAYEAIKRGDIPALRIGRRILVPRAALGLLLADPHTKTGATQDTEGSPAAGPASAGNAWPGPGEPDPQTGRAA